MVADGGRRGRGYYSVVYVQATSILYSERQALDLLGFRPAQQYHPQVVDLASQVPYSCDPSGEHEVMTTNSYFKIMKLYVHVNCFQSTQNFPYL